MKRGLIKSILGIIWFPVIYQAIHVIRQMQQDPVFYGYCGFLFFFFFFLSWAWKMAGIQLAGKKGQFLLWSSISFFKGWNFCVGLGFLGFDVSLSFFFNWNHLRWSICFLHCLTEGRETLLKNSFYFIHNVGQLPYKHCLQFLPYSKRKTIVQSEYYSSLCNFSIKSLGGF